MRGFTGSGRRAASVAGALLLVAAMSGAPVAAQGDGGVVEVFTYWTAGGEAEGLKAAEAVFAEQHPDVAIQNTTIAGGAGVNANVVLANRMAGGDPPDAFQIHGGAELLDNWVKGNDLTQPLTDLFEAEGLADKFPAGIIDLVSWEGVPYSIPLGVHRNGVLWTNKAIFDEHGLTAPTTWDEFFTVADTLKAAGVTPLALGDRDGWTALNLFQQILLSQLGAEDYPRHLGRHGALDRRAGHRGPRDVRSRAGLCQRGSLDAELGPGLADARGWQGCHERHGRLGEGLLHEQGLDPGRGVRLGPGARHRRHLHGGDRLLRAAARGTRTRRTRSCGSRRSRRSRRRMPSTR